MRAAAGQDIGTPQAAPLLFWADEGLLQEGQRPRARDTGVQAAGKLSWVNRGGVNKTGRQGHCCGRA